MLHSAKSPLMKTAIFMGSGTWVMPNGDAGGIPSRMMSGAELPPDALINSYVASVQRLNDCASKCGLEITMAKAHQLLQHIRIRTAKGTFAKKRHEEGPGFKDFGPRFPLTEEDTNILEIIRPLYFKLTENERDYINKYTIQTREQKQEAALARKANSIPNGRRDSSLEGAGSTKREGVINSEGGTAQRCVSDAEEGNRWGRSKSKGPRDKSPDAFSGEGKIQPPLMGGLLHRINSILINKEVGPDTKLDSFHYAAAVIDEIMPCLRESDPFYLMGKASLKRHKAGKIEVQSGGRHSVAINMRETLREIIETYLKEKAS